MKNIIILCCLTLLLSCSFGNDDKSDETTTTNPSILKPVDYDYISQGFGNQYSQGRYHTGVDFSTGNRNDAVKAFIDGKIEFINKNTYTTEYDKYWNSLIVVKSLYKNKTIYLYFGHLNNYQYSEGSTIKKNDTIGYIRNAYDINGNLHRNNNHLHLSVKSDLVKSNWGYISQSDVWNYGWQNSISLFSW